MDIFKVVGSINGLTQYKENLETILSDINDVREKLTIFLTYQVGAKRIVSPTFLLNI